MRPKNDGKESARITPYDLTTARNRAIVRSVAIEPLRKVVNSCNADK